MVEHLKLVRRDFIFYDEFRYVFVGVRRTAKSFLRKYGINDNVYFYNYKIEVDFVVPEQSLAVQVCYKLGDESSETYRRETTALVRHAKRLPYHDLYIVTYNEEREIEIDGLIIKVVPAWKWMLAN